MIQGGGFDNDYKPIPAPAKVVNESGNGLTNVRGTVGMARSDEPHGGDAQFYVNLYDNEALDPNRRVGATRSSARSFRAWMWSTRSAMSPPARMGLFKEDAPVQPVVIERIERVPPLSRGRVASMTLHRPLLARVAALFISDLHIDASRPAITEQFLGFLAAEARSAPTPCTSSATCSNPGSAMMPRTRRNPPRSRGFTR